LVGLKVGNFPPSYFCFLSEIERTSALDWLWGLRKVWKHWNRETESSNTGMLLNDSEIQGRGWLLALILCYFSPWLLSIWGMVSRRWNFGFMCVLLRSPEKEYNEGGK
jgi:hypothetical protein